MIYAQPGTAMVEGHGPNLGTEMRYRVTWMDLQGHVHTTPRNLIWGEAYALADRLDHGEAYSPPATIH